MQKSLYSKKYQCWKLFTWFDILYCEIHFSYTFQKRPWKFIQFHLLNHENSLGIFFWKANLIHKNKGEEEWIIFWVEYLRCELAQAAGSVMKKWKKNVSHDFENPRLGEDVIYSLKEHAGILPAWHEIVQWRLGLNITNKSWPKYCN